VVVEVVEVVEVVVVVVVVVGDTNTHTHALW
jgi:hypothetical protein